MTRTRIYSYPKSGRTWLRFLLANYISLIHDLPGSVNLQNAYDLVPSAGAQKMSAQVATIFDMSFEVAPMKPPGLGVLLLRDPRDILVSFWAHNSFQHGTYSGSLAEFIRDPQLGALPLAHWLEKSASNIQGSSYYMVTSYEELTLATFRVCRDLLTRSNFIVDPASLQSAVVLASFSNMSRVEESFGLRDHNYDWANPQARRVRRGLVGGYSDYLTDQDVKYIDDVMSDACPAGTELLSGFGYEPRT